MKIISEEKFSYSLLEDEADGEWYLTFMSGGVFDVDICVFLILEEVLSIKSDLSKAKDLVRSFMDDRSLYTDKGVVPSKRPKRNN